MARRPPTNRARQTPRQAQRQDPPARRRAPAAEPTNNGRTELDVTNDLGNMVMEYLVCRDLGHHWRRSDFQRTATGRIERGMKCRTCKTEKYEKLAWDGRVVSRVYVYPENYLLHATSDRRTGVRVQLVRAELIRRELGEEE